MLEVASFSVAKSQGDAEGHEAERRDKKDDDAFGDGPLASRGGCFGGAVAHRAGLAKGWRGRHENSNAEDGGKQGGTKFHFGPSERMRKASGKKIIIRAKHTTREAMVSHFIRETSNFMCMK